MNEAQRNFDAALQVLRDAQRELKEVIARMDQARIVEDPYRRKYERLRAAAFEVASDLLRYADAPMGNENTGIAYIMRSLALALRDAMKNPTDET